MSANQKEYKMSRLTHGLAATESLQVLHSEETLAYNTVLAYYFMQGSQPESPKSYISHQEKSTSSILTLQSSASLSVWIDWVKIVEIAYGVSQTGFEDGFVGLQGDIFSAGTC